MPISNDLFSADDPIDLRRWCAFQLYDMPRDTQTSVIAGLRTLLDRPNSAALLQALQVNLPGVGLDYQRSWEFQTYLSAQPFLLVFRFYTGQPSALLPARIGRFLQDRNAVSRILRDHRPSVAPSNPRESPQPAQFRTRTLSRDRWQRPAPPGRMGSSSYRETPHMIYEHLSASPVTADDLGNNVGCNERDLMVQSTLAKLEMTDAQKAEIWMSYKHQTGRRHDSPFLSCTAVMPRMVRSGSAVLRVDVMPQAPYLGLFLIPKENALVQWIHTSATELASVIHSVDEVEVLYKHPPAMECHQLLRFRNPWCLTNQHAAIPGIGSGGEPGTRYLSETPVPGFDSEVPGLIQGGDLLRVD